MSYSGAPPDAYREALLAKERVIPIAALADRRVIGGLVAYEMDKFEQKRREIYICDLAVLEPFRRQGAAGGLIALCSRSPKRGALGSSMSRLIMATKPLSRFIPSSAGAKM